MVATPLTASQVQALYPSSSAQNQRDRAQVIANGVKGIRREVGPGRVVETKGS